MPKLVDNLGKLYTTSRISCVQKADKLWVIPSMNVSFMTYAHFVRRLYTELMNRFFSELTDDDCQLYAASTGLTITTYLNKGILYMSCVRPVYIFNETRQLINSVNNKGVLTQ